MVGAGLAAVGAIAASARGQAIHVEQPATFVVGTPAGGARAERVDAARSGRAHSRLPRAHLHTEWRIPLGTLLEHAPLVDAGGGSYVVGTHGEVVAVARDGAERWRVATGAAQPGPAALLSDDTLVFVDTAGQAVAVRAGAVRWRVRFGRGDVTRPAPLPLEDGGVLVATSRELCALDRDGRERARTVLPEPSSVPLVGALGKVVAVGASGAVWSWRPGADVERVGAFPSPVDGGAALLGSRKLLAVTAGQAHIEAVDLVDGTAATLAVAPAPPSGGSTLALPSLWLGPPSVQQRAGPARAAAPAIFVELLAPSGELALALDPSGAELSRVLLTAHAPAVAPDGGAPGPSPSPHTAPLVDALGSLAFATEGGAIGVAGGGRSELLGQEICEPPDGRQARGVAPVVGLAPLEDDAFVAACRAGALLAIRGTAYEGEGEGEGEGAARGDPAPRGKGGPQRL
ncbi:MAG: PQQ-binding-like beta-propeller repeat protein [Myxococcales bacterium]|nr:PQQ-binding-like beta-propeller repeat protein [Myxococcales bacterium]